MRIAVLLNSHAIEGEYPLSTEEWSAVYRDFLQSSTEGYNRSRPGEMVELEYSCFDATRIQYPDQLESLDAILLTGGTDSFFEDIPWVTKMIQFLRDVHENHKYIKLIGICWGHQVIAHALGGQVIENPQGTECGITEVKLNSDGEAMFGRSELRMHQIHRRIVSRMPEGFQCLGFTKMTEISCMTSANRILTFQGHPELTEYVMRACLSNSAHFGENKVLNLDGDHDGLGIGARIIEFIQTAAQARTSALKPAVETISLQNVQVQPPLINSSSPWASSHAQLRELYDCPFTGAVTTRTSMIDGFPEDDSHTHVLQEVEGRHTSYNTYGFSPHPLSYYLECIMKIYGDESNERVKPFIVSIGGSTAELIRCIELIQRRRDFLRHSKGMEICVELNLSCPNIPHHPPPSYDAIALDKIMQEVVLPSCRTDPSLVIGLKITPFTYRQQFSDFCGVLSKTTSLIHGVCPVTYIAATNTLGGAMPVSSKTGTPMLPGAGIGGMAGHALHSLSLGTVSTLRTLLRSRNETKHIRIIGIGGVSDAEGFRRMKTAGADVVAVATALGASGVEVFRKIQSESGTE